MVVIEGGGKPVELEGSVWCGVDEDDEEQDYNHK